MATSDLLRRKRPPVWFSAEDLRNLRDVLGPAIVSPGMNGLDRREAAFNALYDAHYRALYRYALVAAGPSDAEDIVAEAFQKAYFALPADHGAIVNPRAWLLTIARRTVIDAARRNHRRPAEAIGAHDPAGPDVLQARETWMWFAAVTRELPEQARQALYMRYAGGLSGEEIGSALGLTASGVRSAIGRALEVIRRQAQETGR